MQPSKVPSTMTKGSKAIMQLLNYQSLKVSNTNNLRNIKVCIITVLVYEM